MTALALDLHCMPSLTDEPRRATLVLVESTLADDALAEVGREPANDGQYPARRTYHYDPASREIRYEEYQPYGTSAYHAMDSSVDVSAKRYRYTGWSGMRKRGGGTTRLVLRALLGQRPQAATKGSKKRAEPSEEADVNLETNDG